MTQKTNTELGIFETHTFTVAATIDAIEEFIYEVNHKDFKELKMEISLEEGNPKLFASIKDLINNMFKTYITAKDYKTNIITNTKPTPRS